jgi:hypothetical protein
MISTPHQILLVAAVLFVLIGATAGLSIWLTRGLFYNRGYRDGMDMIIFDRQMEAAYPDEERVAYDLQNAPPSKVCGHETEGL